MIGDAYEAGVSVTAPTMKRAAALLAALEEAKANSARTAQANAEDKELGTKLDALFGGGRAAYDAQRAAAQEPRQAKRRRAEPEDSPVKVAWAWTAVAIENPARHLQLAVSCGHDD